MQKHQSTGRTGAAAVALIVVLVTVDLIIIGMVLTGGREDDLTVKRVETIRAFYAAEAGMNMSIKEVMEDADYDTDGVIGTISDDGDSGNDPVMGDAMFFVSISLDTPAVGQDTLTSEGRSGEARRTMSGVLE